MADDLRERIREELKRRGAWSVRRAAKEAAVRAAQLDEEAPSNTTMSRYMAGEDLTAGSRRGFALAFGWDMNWPENPPPVPVSDVEPEAVELILTAITSSTASATGVLRRIDRRLAAIERHLDIDSDRPVRRSRPSAGR